MQQLIAGARVRGRYRCGWYPGTVKAVRKDGTCTIKYDAGDEEKGVPPHCVMELHDAEGDLDKKQQRAQMPPASKDDARMCGTPGCLLPDWHAGLCTPLANLSERGRGKVPARYLPEKAERPRDCREAVSKLKRPRTDATSRAFDQCRSKGANPGREVAHPDLDKPALWVQCDRCTKWRLLVGVESVDEGADWYCEMSTDPRANSCDAPQTSACRDVCEALSPDMYYVERILDERASRKPGSGWEYLVRWLGWSPEHDSWEPESNISDRTLIVEYHQRKGTQTDSIIPATWAFVSDCPSVGGRGLFARGPLQPNQAICEYGGPRLPMALQTRDGKYVLRLPRTRIVVDGNCDNLPDEYERPRYAAIFANHSANPNARMEYWPDLCATGFREHEVSGSMWLVANEPIAMGAEIRLCVSSDRRRGARTATSPQLPTSHPHSPPPPPTCL